MCHRCVYTGSFELDYLRTLLASLHVHRIEIYLPSYPRTHKTKQIITNKRKKRKKQEKNNKCYCRYVVIQGAHASCHANLGVPPRNASREAKIHVQDGKKCLTMKSLFRNVVFTVIVSFYSHIEDTNVSFFEFALFLY